MVSGLNNANLIDRTADVGARRILGVDNLTHWVNTGEHTCDTFAKNSNKSSSGSKFSFGKFLTACSAVVAGTIGILYLHKTGKLAKAKEFVSDKTSSLYEKLKKFKNSSKEVLSESYKKLKKEVQEKKDACVQKRAKKIEERKTAKALKKQARIDAKAQKTNNKNKRKNANTATSSVHPDDKAMEVMLNKYQKKHSKQITQEELLKAIDKGVEWHLATDVFLDEKLSARANELIQLASEDKLKPVVVMGKDKVNVQVSREIGEKMSAFRDEQGVNGKFFTGKKGAMTPKFLLKLLNIDINDVAQHGKKLQLVYVVEKNEELDNGIIKTIKTPVDILSFKIKDKFTGGFSLQEIF